MNTIKGVLLGISKVVLPLLAGIMCISVLLIAGMSITYLSITGLIAITLYCLVPKTWGVIPLSVCVIAGCLYFYMLILSIFYQPGYVILFGLVPVMAILSMLKGKPIQIWLVVLLIFILSAVYYLFNNNIAGPMQFRITDRPIDTPSQWGNNWRLYWFGIYASTVAWIGGVISIVVMLLYHLYKVWQGR